MNLKKFYTLIASFFIGITAIPVSATVFFSGETGIQTSFSKSDVTDKLGMNIDGFMAGQLGLNDNIFLRAELSIKTSDILDSGIFKDTESAIALNEISLNYITASDSNKTHQLSLFAGNSDPIGTDRFLRHQFGLKKITSPLTESFIGTDGLQIYPFSGIGGAYTLRFGSKPVALGFYIYKNDENEDSKSQPNIDLRLAAVTKYCTFDFAGGIGVPFSRENELGEKVVLYIDKVYVHTGLTMLLGQTDSNSFFLQTGFPYLEFASSSDFSGLKSEDLFVIAEARFRAFSNGVNMTIFNIPQELLKETVDSNGFTYNKLLYIEDSLGFGITAFSDFVNISGKDFKFGMNAIISFEDCYFGDLSDFDKLRDNKHLKIAPFASTDLMNGNLTTTFQVNVFDVKDNLGKALKFTLGYKKAI